MICVVIPSIISIEFPLNNETYQGYFGLAQGLGLLLGPILSTLLVEWLHYWGTFLFFALFILVAGLISACSLPAYINKAASRSEKIASLEQVVNNTEEGLTDRDTLNDSNHRPSELEE